MGALPPTEEKPTPARSRWPVAPRRDMSIVQLLPNMLTVAAICAGLASIRFSAAEAFSAAVVMISTAGTSAMSLANSSKIPLSKKVHSLLGYLRLWALAQSEVDCDPTCQPPLKVVRV